MKKIIAVFVGLILFATIGTSQSIRRVKIGDVLKIADTSTVPLVINFMATWCGPCVNELPWFEKTVPNYKDKGVRLLLVSLDYSDDYPKTILAFAKKKGIASQIVWLDETDPNYFCLKVDKRWEGTIPVTLMVNNKTHLRKFYDHQLPVGQLKLALDNLVE